MDAMKLITDGIIISLVITIPVSYTHLDVYKRQVKELSKKVGE